MSSTASPDLPRDRRGLGDDCYTTRMTLFAPPARDFDKDTTVYTVSRLNHDAKQLLELGLGRIWLEGEVSNFVRASSGHWYLTLKDERAQVRAAMFSQTNRRQAISPSNGMKVLARAQVSLYEPRGDYQLILEHLEHAGEGVLRQRFELLKSKLTQEGLFDAARKKPLPSWPRRIGVITSPTGAAIRDILHILNRRAPAVEVVVYPVAVQGEKAAPEIAKMIAIADQRHEVDVLIIARGGGSLEDLWAFNEEIVARAVSDCSLPTISGVGHEIDFTICDWVADCRAPTPSGAAEIATPDQATTLRTLVSLERRLTQAQHSLLKKWQLALHHLSTRLTREHPSAQLHAQHQRLDELSERLRVSVTIALQSTHWRWNDLKVRLQAHSPSTLLTHRRQQLERLESQLHSRMHQELKDRQHVLTSMGRTLHAVSPLATLERGYTIVQNERGQVLSSIEAVKDQTTLQLTMSDGTVTLKPVF